MSFIFLVYFIYGLAFFSLGLVVLVEIQRMPPSAPQVRLLIPLTIFGFLHGIHEWIEMFMIVTGKVNDQYELLLGWSKALLLAASFIALWLYGLETVIYANPATSFLARVGMITLPVFGLAVAIDVALSFSFGRIGGLEVFSSLTRYLLAVPSAALASIGLRATALKARMDGRRPLDTSLNWTSLGFAAYSLSQLFIPQMNSVFANILNADIFAAEIGIPIQALRSIIALVITVSVFSSVNFLEIERHKQLEIARADRLRAVEKQEELKQELLQQTVRVQEEERTLIAREIHDEMAQTLTAFSLDLATLQKLFQQNSNAAPILARLQELSRELSKNMYHIVRFLRPPHLDDLGLIPALTFLINQEYQQRGLDVELEISGLPYRLDSTSETVVFRVTQEALTNIFRHSGAEFAKVILLFQADSLLLKVCDNGKGFNPERVDLSKGSLGLVGMKERAASIQGELFIDSSIGSGTTIELIIPIQTKEAEDAGL